MRLKSFALGEWQEGSGPGTPLYHAVTGKEIAIASSDGLDFKGMVEHARAVGGPNLRRLTFHERARMLKAMAQYLNERKDAFYELSAATGATKTDSWIDIDGGIGTFFVYASKGRRDFPDETFYIDGPTEALSKGGTFVGRHICVPLEGVAVHINAFNFPTWGMIEKLAPTLLAGVPAIVKPATLTSYLTERVFRAMVESGILPPARSSSFAAARGMCLHTSAVRTRWHSPARPTPGAHCAKRRTSSSNNVRFNLEADSLNYSILGPDAPPGTEEFDLFIKEVVREMTVEGGAEVHCDPSYDRSRRRYAGRSSRRCKSGWAT